MQRFIFGQGGGGRDDDYVTRSEFRLLLVSDSALHIRLGDASERALFAGVPEAVL